MRSQTRGSTTLHLAVSRVSYASGASENFDYFLDDENNLRLEVPAYFDGPFMSDDMLMRRLEVLLVHARFGLFQCLRGSRAFIP